MDPNYQSSTSGYNPEDDPKSQSYDAFRQHFIQFGYYPTDAETAAMKDVGFGVSNNAVRDSLVNSAIAQYVLQKKAEETRLANDPLVGLQKKMDDSIALMKNQVTGLQAQLQDTLSAAPQLFGSLTPDQIQNYLKPLKTTFDQQVAQVQGIAASRGLAASSTENNSIAQTGQQFQEQVLSQGLQVGQQQQSAKANSIQNQINNLFGLTGQEESISAQATGQKSSQDLGQSNLIASLPYFLSQDAYAKGQAFNAAEASRNTGSGMGGVIGGGIGLVAGAYFGQPMLGYTLGSAAGNAVDSSNSRGTSSSSAASGAAASSALYANSLMTQNQNARNNTPNYLTTGQPGGSNYAPTNYSDPNLTGQPATFE